jgi:hypothetical protein
MRRGDEQVLDEVFGARAHADTSLAATGLFAVGVSHGALHVAGVVTVNHVVVGDESVWISPVSSTIWVRRSSAYCCFWTSRS